MNVHDAHDNSCDPTDPSDFLQGYSAEQKSRLTDLLDRYLRGLEEGQPIDSSELVATHPDLAAVFDCYLKKLQSLYGVAVGFTAVDDHSDSTFDPAGSCTRTLGDFLLKREIGRGGMGAVFEAHQQSLNRPVALKLLPMAALLDARQITRFKNEARAAGSLQHPHIVPVYSVGTEQGVHFYAMQLIHGESVDGWIRKNARAGSHPQTLRRIIAWGAEVADALQAAHESGVIHRDIKPSNLMIDLEEKIWVTDFGLARCQTDLSLTRSGDWIGTLRYMSPEQASRRSEAVDHRSDIYSLGVTLYEMLGGRPAILGDDAPIILQAIANEEPPKISSILPHTPPDLAIVLAKAMSKRIDDRYTSATDFASDLKAILAGEPTLAKPLSTATRLGRWTYRHRRSVAIASFVLVVAMVWLVISSFIIHQEMRHTSFAEQRADQYFRQGHATVDRLGTQVAEQLASVPGAEHVRQSLLLETLNYYEQFVAAAAGDSKLETELAVTQSRIGVLEEELHSAIDAIPHFKLAAETFARCKNNASIETKRQAALNLNHFALALAETNQVDVARIRYLEALSLQQSLRDVSPEDAQIAAEWAVTTSNLGLLLRDTQHFAEAKEQLNAAIVVLAPLVESQPDHEFFARALSAALTNLSSLSLESDTEQSISLLELALKKRLKDSAHGENRLRTSSEIANLYNNLGSAQFRANRFGQAEDAFTRATRLQRQLVSIAPRVDAYRRDLATTLNNLTLVFQKKGDHHAARISSEEAIELQEQVLVSSGVNAEDHRRLAAMQHNLVATLMSLDLYQNAEPVIRQAIQHETEVLKLTPQWPNTRSNLLDHFAMLLKCQIRTGDWNGVELTAASYRQAAGDDPHLVQRVEGDLKQASQFRSGRTAAPGTPRMKVDSG